MFYNGFYINLDSATERRAEIISELAKHGLNDRYRRFPAIVGNGLGFPAASIQQGAVGCFSSHYQLLKEQRGANQPLHIIEDDVLFSPQTAQVLQWAIDQGLLANYDILYTDVAVPVLNDVFAAYRRFYDSAVSRNPDGSLASVLFKVADLRDMIFASTSSFLINPASIDKLVAFYGAALEKGAAVPIDIFIRNLCKDGALRVGCIIPFVTAVRIERTLDSSIEPRGSVLSVLAANVARQTFFIGCDWGQCRAMIDQHLTLPENPTEQDKILAHLLAFSMTKPYLTPVKE